MQSLKAILKKTFVYKMFRAYVQPWRTKVTELEKRTPCYSQEGEDLILDTFLYDLGFFIDIGSYHPTKFSNTYLFYLKGWRGINIDARPNSMKIFNELRPNDINLEVAIGKEEKTLTYYMFDEPGLNGFSKEISEDRNSNTPYKIIERIDLPLRRLETVLDEYLPKNTPIAFMSIDVEGFDLEVLQSNNWDRFRPTIVLVETSVVSEGIDTTSPIHIFLVSKGFQLVAKTFRTSFYKSEWN